MKIKFKAPSAIVALLVLAMIGGTFLLRPAGIERKVAEPVLRRWLQAKYGLLSKDELGAIQLDPQGAAAQEYARRMENINKIEFPILESKRAWMKPRHSVAAVVVKVQINFATGSPPDGKTIRHFLLSQKYWGSNWEVHREISEGEFRWGIG